PHAKHVRLLPLDIRFAHIDDAWQAETRSHRCRRDAVLACASLCDDARLAHAPRQQDLAHAIIDLVRAGVIELVALEIDFGAAETPGQPSSKIRGRGPADIVVEELVELGLEGGVFLRRVIALLEVEDRRHQGFGDVAPAINTEMTLRIWAAAIGIEPR